MQKNTFEKIKEYISNLSGEGAFEIWSKNGNFTDTDIYIPYMMNDAMECFIELKNASLVGTFDRELMSDTAVSIEDSKDARTLLVINQANFTNVCTILFGDAQIHKKLYRFDEICHYWRSGFEQWSQLTYIIGTMYDKYLWGGKSVCNKDELAVMKLIEFAPFRAFAPAPELFEELYDNTYEAVDLMEQLANEAHDYSYAFLCKLYRRFPTEKTGRLLSNKLKSEKRFQLYTLIYEKATKGASQYDERHYLDECDNELIKNSRKNADSLMRKMHFQGNFPDYHRGNVYVRITEEHPFTIMDWDEITYSLKFMVSVCDGKYRGMNLGFFEGKGNRCEVLGEEEFRTMQESNDILTGKIKTKSYKSAEELFKDLDSKPEEGDES